jgi:hypothetical protein
MEVEWVAPQSLMTQPANPRRVLRSRLRVVGFSHAQVPFAPAPFAPAVAEIWWLEHT